ncbi:MAG: hypothetical protein LBT87_00070 [Treponema sp.]|jgi:hypothetical protein|nr:hypothetical protein [Treponema sp.]
MKDTSPSTLHSYVRDIFIYGLCILGILLFLNLFRLDLFRTLTRQTEAPIGTITFKYRAAQRRFTDRVLWDRLKKESPVYEGDLIRTAELSEATVTFGGGSAVINLAENTLIQLHGDDGGFSVDISKGVLSAGAGDSPLTLVSGDRRITVEAGGMAQAGTENGELTLRVMEGTASFTGPDGSASVAAGETLALGDAGPRALREAVALFPRPQERFLKPGSGKFTVPFRWNRASLSPEETTRLEIAEDRSFARIVFSGEFDGDRAAVDLDGGSYFWRVSAAQGEGPAPTTLSFRVIPAPAPALIIPAESYRYQFRTRRPSVRFLWTETEEADLYMLEVADNPDMRNPALSQEVRGTSFYSSALGPGTWYWRVRPVFPAAFQGAPGEATPASFSIVQSGDLRVPELQLPQDRGLVNVASGRGDVYFSWRSEAEASSYRILLSTNRDLSNPLLDERVRDNFYVRRAGQNAMAPGQYYWAVSQTDIEGNDSILAPARSFTALEGDLIQRLVFPPEGYIVDTSLLPDLRFTWKTNLPFQTRFQVSESPGFSSVLVDEAAGGEVFQGRAVPAGTWYWRIQARGTGDAVFETPPRSFVAAPPIDAPLLLEPAPGGRVATQEGESLVFSWASPEGAEYYQFKLYHEEEWNRAVYENNLVEEASRSLPVDSYPEGNYRWSVQGLAPESFRNTRRTGLLSEGVFRARKIHPVILDYPGDNTVFEGLLAYREPETLRWSSEDQVGTSSFILSRSADFAEAPVLLVNNPPQGITLPRLWEGNYYWTVRAETPDGYDISAKAPLQFRVLPIPLLPAAANRLPVNGKIIGEAELRANRRILFSWDAVTGATGYLFTLENADTGNTVMRQGPMTETALTLEDLSLLDVGAFTWHLEAVWAEAAGDIVQRGETGENQFTIDFGLPTTPELRRPGTLYGREE